jgi:hypothetical protein
MNMTTVHTYYEPVPEIDETCQQKEIAIWRESWERWGWTAKVLGRADVQIAPVELERLQRLPSVNPPGYDLACYLRWFAMRALGGGLLTDYDVVNVGLRPADLGWDGASTASRILCSGLVPCAMELHAAGAAQLCDMMVSYEPTATDVFEGHSHVSDMTILQSTQPAHLAILWACCEPQHADEHTLLLHVSHNAMAAMGLDDWHRHDVMRVLAGLGMARAETGVS